MSLRTRLARFVVATLIAFTALVSVGLTAPADGPFSIAIRPVFLGLELSVKFGPVQFHYEWSAIPLPASTTKTTSALL